MSKMRISQSLEICASNYFREGAGLTLTRSLAANPALSGIHLPWAVRLPEKAARLTLPQCAGRRGCLHIRFPPLLGVCLPLWPVLHCLLLRFQMRRALTEDVHGGQWGGESVSRVGAGTQASGPLSASLGLRQAQWGLWLPTQGQNLVLPHLAVSSGQAA